VSPALLKTSFSIAAVVAILLFVQTSTALNALLLFAAAGIVPGTHITLTPDGTLWVLGSLMALSFLLIFSGNILRGLRALWRHKPAQDTPQVVKEHQPAPSPIAAVVSKIETPKPVVVITIPRQPGRLAKAVRALAAGSTYILTVVAEQAPIIWRELLSRSQYAFGVMCLYIAHGWRWLRPRLVQAKHAITAKLNQHQDISFVITFLRSCSKVLGSWYADIRTRSSRYLTKLHRQLLE
jgi:hypothetical protein